MTDSFNLWLATMEEAGAPYVMGDVEEARCFDFNVTHEHYLGVFVTQLTLASMACVASCVAFVTIVLCKGYKRFVYRLVLYLMATNLFQSLTNILEGLPMTWVKLNGVGVVTERNESAWKELCVVDAFLNQIAIWMQNFIILWIIFYLLMIVWKLARVQQQPYGHQSGQITKPGVSKKELVGVIFCVGFPFIFNWIPFAKNLYGPSGMWCWIKLTNSLGCHSHYKLGLTLTFLLYYGPLLVIFSFSSAAIVYIVIFLCIKYSKAKGELRLIYRKALKEMLPLLAYPILFNILCTLLIANRVSFAVSTHNGHSSLIGLWIAEAVVDPMQLLLPPVAFVIHPSTWKNLLYPTELDDVTRFEVSAQSEDRDPLVIQGRNANYQSIFNANNTE